MINLFMGSLNIYKSVYPNQHLGLCLCVCLYEHFTLDVVEKINFCKHAFLQHCCIIECVSKQQLQHWHKVHGSGKEKQTKKKKKKMRIFPSNTSESLHKKKKIIVRIENTINLHVYVFIFQRSESIIFYTTFPILKFVEMV